MFSLQTYVPSTKVVALSNAKTGMSGARLQSRAEFRETWASANGKKLGRSEAEKLHNEYLRSEGIKGNAELASQIAKGHILVLGVRSYQKSGKGTISFVDAAKVVEKAAPVAPSMEQALAALGITAEDLAAVKLGK